MKNKLIQTITNPETGEVLYEETIILKKDSKVTKAMVDKMLSEAKSEADIDTNMLYVWCRITKSINSYGQIQTFGNKLNDGVEDLLLEEGVVCAYVLKAIKLAHPFSCILKSNHKRFINTWKELYEAIGCRGRKEQIRVKKFLTDNGLIDMFRINSGGREVVKRLVLNPYLYKGASHSGQIACILWQGYAKEGININIYAYRWLQGMGYIA